MLGSSHSRSWNFTYLLANKWYCSNYLAHLNILDNYLHTSPCCILFSSCPNTTCLKILSSSNDNSFSICANSTSRNNGIDRCLCGKIRHIKCVEQGAGVGHDSKAQSCSFPGYVVTFNWENQFLSLNHTLLKQLKLGCNWSPWEL